jgi:hypothetical protein
MTSSRRRHGTAAPHRAVRRVLALLASIAFSGCGLHGRELCSSINLETPIDSLATAPYPFFGQTYSRITWSEGPAKDIECCRGTCSPNCACGGVDCSQSIFTQGQAFTIPDATVQWDDGVSLCGVWSVEARVKAVWWEDDY